MRFPGTEISIEFHMKSRYPRFRWTLSHFFKPRKTRDMLIPREMSKKSFQKQRFEKKPWWCITIWPIGNHSECISCPQMKHFPKFKFGNPKTEEICTCTTSKIDFHADSNDFHIDGSTLKNYGTSGNAHGMLQHFTTSVFTPCTLPKKASLWECSTHTTMCILFGCFFRIEFWPLVR